jgi:uncharacterized protein involved in outer membrane biogenesis
MKKLKKIILIGGITVVVLLIVGVIIVATNLDSIVKKGIETVGPEITKVSITLDSIHIGLLSGSAKVKGLVVGNPDGYKAPSAISVGLAEVSVSPASVLSDKIVIHTVHVIAPEITFEGNPLGKNNISKILDNLNAANKSGAAPATNQTATASNKPAQKLEVDDFLISDAKVHFNGTTLSLPPVHLTDLGKGTDGITATDLSKQVLTELTGAVLKAVASSAIDLGKEGGNLGKDAGKDVNKITKGLGGLFGK